MHDIFTPENFRFQNRRMKLKKDQKNRRGTVVSSSVHSNSPSSDLSPSGSANSAEKLKVVINGGRSNLDELPFPKFFTEMLPEMNWLREVSQPPPPNASANFYSKTLIDSTTQWINGRQQSLMAPAVWSASVTVPTGSSFNVGSMYYGTAPQEDICSPFSCALTNLPLRTAKHHGHHGHE